MQAFACPSCRGLVGKDLKGTSVHVDNKWRPQCCRWFVIHRKRKRVHIVAGGRGQRERECGVVWTSVEWYGVVWSSVE